MKVLKKKLFVKWFDMSNSAQFHFKGLILPTLKIREKLTFFFSHAKHIFYFELCEYILKYAFYLYPKRKNTF